MIRLALARTVAGACSGPVARPPMSLFRLSHRLTLCPVVVPLPNLSDDDPGCPHGAATHPGSTMDTRVPRTPDGYPPDPRALPSRAKTPADPAMAAHLGQLPVDAVLQRQPLSRALSRASSGVGETALRWIGKESGNHGGAETRRGLESPWPASWPNVTPMHAMPDVENVMVRYRRRPSSSQNVMAQLVT